MRLKPVEEQIVALMGASSGIGRVTALRFAERGAKVIVSAKNEKGLDSLVEEIRSKGGQATAIPAEVTEFEQVKAVADGAVETYGRLDTWVHLAAVLLVASFEDTTPEEFSRVVDVNLMGQVHGAMAALPHIKREGGGALIHVSSMGAKPSIPLQSAYCASKHGIDGFLESLRVELQHEKLPISVTHVMPATINTPLFDKARTKLGVKPVAPPPIYQPGIVADAILHAAEHPARDLVVGGAARAVMTAQQISPRLLDALLRRFGFGVHYTNDPKTEEDPDNLFDPVQGLDTVEGSFGDRAHPKSLYDWIELHPTLKRATALGAALAALAIVRGRS
jgi:NAD(P)-dependent dehydrogenase (short-subunit alcohol dehydrogenase family)